MELIRHKSSVKTSATELTLLIFGIIAFMYFTGEILKPLAISVLLSFALTPAVRLLERLGFPRPGAVVLTLILVLALIGGIGYVVGEQVASLAKRLPDYTENIESKLKRVFNSERESTSQRLNVMVERVKAKLEKKPSTEEEEGYTPIQKVAIVDQPSFQDRLRSASGPYLEFLGICGFILILVLFMLVGREDLRDRIVGLFGERQVGITTRTMEEISQRISRYLATFALVNSSFGFVIGLGLWFIGVPYAVLWGCLAGMLRFIPYVGPAVALALPLIFSFANFPGWIQPLEVVSLFGAVEIALNSFLEPVIYGKTTGVSALGLLIAAMFWTWLWGTPGLLLSTPLTVCLAVLGKYVPSLRFFATILEEKVELEPDVRLYQRLLALDRAGAEDVVESELKSCPRIEFYDKVLIPTLARTEYDSARGQLDDSERTFIWDLVGDVIDQLENVEEFDLASAKRSSNGSTPQNGLPSSVSHATLVGVGVEGRSDELVLQMLKQLLNSTGLQLELISTTETPLQVADRVSDLSATIAVVSHFPSNGVRSTCYLVRRLRARFAEMEILVGRWGEPSIATADSNRLTELGATHVFFSLVDLRRQILKATATVVTTPNAETAPLPV